MFTISFWITHDLKSLLINSLSIRGQIMARKRLKFTLLFLSVLLLSVFLFFPLQLGLLKVVIYFQILVLQKNVFLAFSSLSPSLFTIVTVIMSGNACNYYNFLKILFFWICFIKKNTGKIKRHWIYANVFLFEFACDLFHILKLHRARILMLNNSFTINKIRGGYR